MQLLISSQVDPTGKIGLQTDKTLHRFGLSIQSNIFSSDRQSYFLFIAIFFYLVLECVFAFSHSNNFDFPRNINQIADFKLLKHFCCMDRQTDRPTNLVLKVLCQSLKMESEVRYGLKRGLQIFLKIRNPTTNDIVKGSS